jgi:hypothetical protein
MENKKADITVNYLLENYKTKIHKLLKEPGPDQYFNF